MNVSWTYFGGFVSIVPTERIENGVWILGGITREYDRNGKIVRESRHDNLRVELP